MEQIQVLFLNKYKNKISILLKRDEGMANLHHLLYTYSKSMSLFNSISQEIKSLVLL